MSQGFLKVTRMMKRGTAREFPGERRTYNHVDSPMFHLIKEFEKAGTLVPKCCESCHVAFRHGFQMFE